jgi:hypothetical protein
MDSFIRSNNEHHLAGSGQHQGFHFPRAGCGRVDTSGMFASCSALLLTLNSARSAHSITLLLPCAVCLLCATCSCATLAALLPVLLAPWLLALLCSFAICPLAHYGPPSASRTLAMYATARDSKAVPVGDRLCTTVSAMSNFKITS